MHRSIKATRQPKSNNLYNRKCELGKGSQIKLTHIGGDYIGVTVDGEYVEIEGFGQHIVWELMTRLGL